MFNDNEMTNDNNDNIGTFNKEIDKAIEQTISPVESDLLIKDVASKLEKICNDIIKVLSMINYQQVNLTPSPDRAEDNDYFDFADIETSIINLVKEQVKALKNITDRI